MLIKNSILFFTQNIAQAPLIEELLSENLKSIEAKLCIKHNDDYDSELTDFEEDSTICFKTNASNTTTNEDNDSYMPYNLSDFNNNTNSLTVPTSGHRSIRLKEMHIVLNEGPGFLTRSLHELIKAMSSSSSTVNPGGFHSAFCKKY